MRNLLGLSAFLLVVLLLGSSHAETAVPNQKGDAWNVYFSVNSAALSDKAEAVLKAQAEFLRKYPDKNILIEGYCDTVGSAEFNYRLGLQRANAVRNYLLEQGIAQRRMDVISYGEKQAEALPEGENEQELNRRVTLKIR